MVQEDQKEVSLHCSRCCSYEYAHTSAPPLLPDWDWEDPISPQSANPSAQDASNHLLLLIPQLTKETSLDKCSSLIDVAGTNIQVASHSASSSYQQYMIPNLHFGLPVSINKAKPAGFFSCALNNFLTCFCPCLSIRDRCQHWYNF